MSSPSNEGKFFEKSVDICSRESMVAFLRGHYRYYDAPSYANRVKFGYLGLSRELQDKAFNYLGADTSDWTGMSDVIADFTSEHNGRYTISQYGRSGGYLVLMQSEYVALEYKSHCLSCGQRNYQAVADTGSNKCGACGVVGERGRVDYTVAPRSLKTTGESLDQNEEFDPEEWSMDRLRERVRLVQSFDAACDDIRASFIEMLQDSEVVEETIVTSRTVRRLVTPD
jgi:hypothetical protein